MEIQFSHGSSMEGWHCPSGDPALCQFMVSSLFFHVDSQIQETNELFSLFSE